MQQPQSNGSVLIDAKSLQARLAREGAAGPGLRVVDLRWVPGKDGRERYDAGHIPGAQFVDLERDVSHAQPRGKGGRHPLVTAEEFAHLLSRLGISPQTQVAVYDDGTSAIAARLWFQLRLHGHDKVSLLDGGLRAWTEAGFPLEKNPAAAPPAAPLRKLVRDESMLVDRAQIAALVANRKGANDRAPLLLDARAPERYRGEVEPLDPIGGHIPGAVNAPFAEFLRAADDPRWRPPEELRELFKKAGAAVGGREVIASCGSGITACHLLAGLEQAGIRGAKLYSGSYSDWLSDPAAPVARGGEPG